MSLYTDLAKRLIRNQGPNFMKRGMLPMKLTVASTFLCNHQCKMCDIWLVYRKDKKKLKEELTRDDFKKIFTEMRHDLLYLDWGGGEPYLRKDMCDILQDAAEICPKLSSIVITTNGLLTDRIVDYTERAARAMPKVLMAVGVSLDGDEATHNFIRGKDDAYGNAMATIEALRELSKKLPNIEVKISYTISYRNAGKLTEFDRDVLRPLGMNMGDVGFGVEHVGGLFQTQTDPEKAVGKVSEGEFRVGAKEDIEYAIAHLKEDDLPALQKMKSVYRKFFLQEIPAFLDEPRKMVIPCTAARSSLYLDPYGFLYPCIVWSKCLGHFSEGIRNILETPKTQETRKQIDEGKCPVCWNACEAIPSLLSSMRVVSCVARSFTDANAIRSLIGKKRVA